MMSSLLSRIRRTPSSPATINKTIIPDETIEGDVITNKSWVEEEINKIKALSKQVENLYNIPVIDSYEDKAMYDYFFKDRDTSKCPSCGFNFNKNLCRAKHCPRCNEFLSVRYGHLLTNTELDEHASRMSVIATTKIGVPNRISEIRLCERHGLHETSKEIAEEIIQQLSKHIK